MEQMPANSDRMSSVVQSGRRDQYHAACLCLQNEEVIAERSSYENACAQLEEGHGPIALPKSPCRRGGLYPKTQRLRHRWQSLRFIMLLPQRAKGGVFLFHVRALERVAIFQRFGRIDKLHRRRFFRLVLCTTIPLLFARVVIETRQTTASTVPRDMYKAVVLSTTLPSDGSSKVRRWTA
jgi:hypothetical protein